MKINLPSTLIFALGATLFFWHTPSGLEEVSNADFFESTFRNFEVQDTLWVTEAHERLHLTNPLGEVSFTICNLIVGKQYEIILNDYNQSDCSAFLNFKNGVQDRQRFTAEASCRDIWLVNNCDEKSAATISISSMDLKNKFSPKNDPAEMGISTNYNFSTQELIEDVFIGGGCFDVSNIQPIGNANGIGHFTMGSSSINIEEGVILASGNLANAHGPNNSTQITTNFFDPTGDPDLSQLPSASAGVFDAVGIEFDFTPTVDMIEFTYAFASDEYCEYVFSPFNDAFGFFISGPGISGTFSNGAENVAIVPMTNDEVSINNVNITTNQAYYEDNVPLGQNQQTSLYWNCSIDLSQQGVAVNDFEFDGFTTPLTAVLNVTPCETYHIRLVVGDVGDGIFDSAVFLKANSFNAGGTAGVEVDLGASASSGIAYEDCDFAYFTFTREGSDLSQPFDVEVNISPNSTATNGVDFTMLPSIVTIPPGQSEIILPIEIFNDGIAEGIETLIVEIENSCTCNTSSVQIDISDVEPLEVELDDQTYCSPQLVPLFPSISGGAVPPPLTYMWSSGQTQHHFTTFVTETTTYTVTVSDVCGNSATADATITIQDIPTATLSGFVEVCDANPTGFLQIDFTGNGPYDVYYALDGVLQDPLIGITDNPYLLPVDQVGTYVIMLMDGGGCPGIPAGVGVVLETTILPLPVPFDVSCAGLNDGHVDLIPVGGTNPYTYQWSNGTGQQNPTNLVAGTYTVTVTDGNGCTGTTEAIVDEPPPVSASAVESAGVNCYNPSGGSIDLTASGGTGSYTYTWDNGAPSVEDPTGLAPGTYNVVVTDSTGCSSTAAATVTEDFTPPMANAQVTEQVTCATPSVTIDGSGSSTGTNFSYQWTTTNGNIVSGATSLNPVVASGGTYDLVVLNTENGCTETAEVTVDQDTENPIADPGPSVILNCDDPEMTLDGSGSSQGNNFSYQWTTTNGNIISGENTLTPVVGGGGTYELVVTNTDNGCTAVQTTLATEDFDPPIASAGAPVELDCTVAVASLDGSGSSAGNNFTYQWTTTNGNISAGETTLFPEVTLDGTYEILVTNLTNGCTSTASVVVTANGVIPTSTIGNPENLTCDVTEIELNATGSSTGNSMVYEWTTTNGNIVSGSNLLTPVVNAPGTYQLVVTDSSNGCSSSASILVEENVTPPNAEANAEGILTCAVLEIQLNGGNSTTGNTSYLWTTNTGNIVSGENTLTPIVSVEGTYNLLITNDLTGCTSEAEVVVETDYQAPTANAGGEQELTCAVLEVTLDGSGSDTGNNFSYQWTTNNGNIVSGENAQNPVVNEPGEYQLLVTNSDNGCTSIADVLVGEDIESPVVNTGISPTVTCAETSVSLNANGSSAGNHFSYQWTTANGNILSGENTLTPEVNEPGIYEILITNSNNGCTSIGNVEVFEDMVAPVADAGPEGLLNCDILEIELLGNNSSTGTAFEYLWTTTNGNILANADSLQPQVNAPGTYELLVTNTENGCTNTSVVEVLLDDTPPIADAGIAQILSCSTPSITLDGGGSSLGNEYIYQWTSPSGNILMGANTLNPQIDAVGIYELVVTNTSNGCTSISEVEVLADASLPVANAGPTFELTCATTVVQLDGSGSSAGNNITYSWTTPDGNILLGNNSLSPEINAPGIYELLVTDSDNGCTAISTVLISEDVTPPMADAGLTAELNCYNTALVLDGSGSDTGSNFSYQWTSPSGNILAGANTLNPEINASGMYNLLITNELTGCTSVANVEITENFDTPIADAGPEFQLDCATSELTLLGDGSSSGNHFIYQWTTPNGNILSNENTLQPLINEPGIYELLVTDTLNGCTAISSVEVLQDIEAPIADAGAADNLTCATTTLALDAGNSSQGNEFTYQWTTTTGNILLGNDTQNPTIDQPGTYTLMVTNTLNQCTSVSEIVVNQDIMAPTADAGSSGLLTCTTTEISLDGSSSSAGNNFSYQWTTTNGNILSGQNSAFPQINSTGIYELLITNTTNGCTAISAVEVTDDVVAPDIVAFPQGILTCDVTSISLNGNGSSTGNEFQYQWTTTTGNILSGGNTLFPQVNAPGIYSLQITNTSNGCTSLLPTEVLQDVTPPDPQIDQTGNLMLDCSVASIVLDASGSTPFGNILFEWTTPNGNILSGANTPNPEVDDFGIYNLLITNALNGCTATSSVPVTQDVAVPLVEIAPPAILTCDVTEVALNANNSSIGNNFTYQWTTPNGNIISGANTLTPMVNQSGTYILTIIDQSNNCENSQSIFLDENITPPLAEAGTADILDCHTESVSLNGTGSSFGNQFVYEWTTANGSFIANVNTLFTEVNAPGVYTLLVTDLQNGCTALDNVLVEEDTNVPTDIIFSLDPPECHGDPGSIIIEGVEGGNAPYLFSVDGENFYSGHIFTLSAGDYTLIAQDAEGCETEVEISIPYLFPVNVVLEPEVTIELGEDYQIQALTNIPQDEIASIQWTPTDYLSCTDCLTPVAMPLNTITYTIYIENIFGCPTEASIIINVEKPRGVYIPNVFTPNGDGLNDKFMIYSGEASIGIKQINHFQIYDRWGETIFQAANFQPDDPDFGWDGIFRGVGMNPAVFVYWAEIEFIDGVTILYKGDVTLRK